MKTFTINEFYTQKKKWDLRVYNISKYVCKWLFFLS